MSTDETPSQGEGTEPFATWRVHCPVGVVELDPGAREVWRDGELVVLAPPVFDCIAYLFAHRERAVGRDELIAAIWGRADITDTVLHQTVMKARRVFGDSGDEQQVLRTGRRMRDRRIATVEGASERAATGSPPPADRRDSRSSAPRPRSTRRRRGVIAIASGVLGIVLLAGVGAWWWRAPAPESIRKTAIEPVDTRPAPTDAIVVLPVEVAAGRDTAWIPLGVMDAIGSYLRDGGEAIVPSQTVIGLIEAQGDSVPEAAQWRDTVGATRVVRAFATQRTDRWQVRLEFEEGGARQETSGEAPEV